jgi:glyoxylase-like metal-dependent hydrolase (beta-lactamase superfamily II)
MPVEELTPGVACLRFLIANVYFVGRPGAPWALVDAGTPGNAARIRSAAARLFGAGARPAAILLTHGHFDHAGSARELAGIWDAPIYAHRLERPFLTGMSAYPPKDPTVGGAMAFLSRFFPSSGVNLGGRLRDLPDGEVPGLPGWQWLHTPGHCPGHVIFFQPDDAILLAGDACTTMDLDSAVGLVTQRRRICRPPAPFTCDWDQAHRSVQLLAGLRPRAIGGGHGKPMKGSAVARELDELARNFPKPR